MGSSSGGAPWSHINYNNLKHTLSFPFRFWSFTATRLFTVFLNLCKSLLSFGSQFRICLTHICLPFFKCSISSWIFVFTILLFSSKLFYLFHTCCCNLSSKLIKSTHLQNLIIFFDFLFYNILSFYYQTLPLYTFKFLNSNLSSEQNLRLKVTPMVRYKQSNSHRWKYWNHVLLSYIKLYYS